MALTPGQKQCIETLDKPLAVCAGAGSGKTYTLTRRIVRALKTGALESIDQVLAITFTKKAANEIKSRVRGALRAEGLIEQSLKVDSAWISTIHGACSRMLRQHALELGIDPYFSVISEPDSENLLDEAIEEVLTRARVGKSAYELDALFGEYRARKIDTKGAFSAPSIELMLKDLVSSASASPGGIDDISLPTCASASDILRRMILAATSLISVLENEKSGKRRDALLEKTQAALEAAQNLCLESGHSEPLDLSSLIDILNKFPVPGMGFGSCEYKELAKDTGCEYRTCMAEVRFGMANKYLYELINLAREVLAKFKSKKREASLLDEDDLLVETALAFKNCPSVQASYKDAFRLVMIDEFQDTDQLQVDIIKHLVGDGMERLCTVGDAQQSIYRFRGADVSVYRRQIDAVCEKNPDGLIELPDNFRSHADVLSFVDCVFAQDMAFGKNFMSLAPSRDEARVRNPFLGNGPRIDVSYVAHSHKGATAKEARQCAAKQIAQRFANLRDAGHSPKDMVLLLGSTSNAAIYAQALRDANFPCVITKGSVFSGASVVQLMVSLARALANPLDNLALFEVLASEFFELSANDFLLLATFLDKNKHVSRRSLWEGLCAMAGENTTSPALIAAINTLARAIERMPKAPLSRVMTQVVCESGALVRFEDAAEQGQADAGNVFKALRIVEKLEKEGSISPVHLANKFAQSVDLAKETPGAMCATEGDFVRIMTVHASKGLEFPIVAVAEVGKNKTSSGKLIIERAKSKLYASLDLDNTIPSKSNACLLKKATDRQARLEALSEDELAEKLIASKTAGERRLILRELTRKAEEQEDLRLLYVALTRAKEALVVSLIGESATNNPSRSASIVSSCILAALGKLDEVPSKECAREKSLFDFGGSTPGMFERINVDALVHEEEGEDGKPGGEEVNVNGKPGGEEASGKDLAAESPDNTFDIFDIHTEQPSFTRPSRFERACVFSYSSLAATGAHIQVLDGLAPNAVNAALKQHASEGQDQIKATSSAKAQTRWTQDDDDAWQAIEDALGFSSSATDFGSAFHRLAQIAAHMHKPGEALICPNDERIDTISARYKLSSNTRARLKLALNKWFSSSQALQLLPYEILRAEVPFFLELESGSAPLYLEGEIDLIATSNQDKGALVIDYKTGGSAQESVPDLRKKHENQAMCYALALLSQGYEQVELNFVRVEQLSDEGSAKESSAQVNDADAALGKDLNERQCVRYFFDASMYQDLKDAIISACRSAQTLVIPQA